MMNDKILIVDDDHTTRLMITAGLRSDYDHNIIEAENGREALEIIKTDQNKTIKLIILDLDMPVIGGLDMLQSLQNNRAQIPVIILTGTKNMDETVAAMKNGATDFLRKPVDKTRLNVAVKNALKLSTLSEEIHQLKRQKNAAYGFENLIGYNTTLTEPIRIANKASACALPTLITGETGTGKEVFARAIHGESERSDKNFIAVNCGAIPEKLVESTLFGHEKGAFTGAHQKTLGKFREAEGGTIFLDEVGELPLDAQVKLLRVLQENEIEPVGAGKSIPVNVRIISATNRDLETEICEGRFREDLYFRLNVLQLEIPPLRHRLEDIPDLSMHFINRYCTLNNIEVKALSDEAQEHLTNHNWSGNIRELENALHRALALSENAKLNADDFEFLNNRNRDQKTLPKNTLRLCDKNGNFKSLEAIEQEVIHSAIEHNHHNMSQTARTLGIAKSTLYAKMEKQKPKD